MTGSLRVRVLAVLVWGPAPFAATYFLRRLFTNTFTGTDTLIGLAYLVVVTLMAWRLHVLVQGMNRRVRGSGESYLKTGLMIAAFIMLVLGWLLHARPAEGHVGVLSFREVIMPFSAIWALILMVFAAVLYRWKSFR